MELLKFYPFESHSFTLGFGSGFREVNARIRNTAVGTFWAGPIPYRPHGLGIILSDRFFLLPHVVRFVRIRDACGLVGSGMLFRILPSSGTGSELFDRKIVRLFRYSTLCYTTFGTVKEGNFEHLFNFEANL